MNYDLQTTRTMEIPACGSLLMAERTIEHEELFKDEEEAVFSLLMKNYWSYAGTTFLMKKNGGE